MKWFFRHIHTELRRKNVTFWAFMPWRTSRTASRYQQIAIVRCPNFGNNTFILQENFNGDAIEWPNIAKVLSSDFPNIPLSKPQWEITWFTIWWHKSSVCQRSSERSLYKAAMRRKGLNSWPAAGAVPPNVGHPAVSTSQSLNWPSKIAQREKSGLSIFEPQQNNI